jgi:hypothetical protein
MPPLSARPQQAPDRQASSHAQAAYRCYEFNRQQCRCPLDPDLDLLHVGKRCQVFADPLCA